MARAGGCEHDVLALYEWGVNVNLITHRAAQKIGLKPIPSPPVEVTSLCGIRVLSFCAYDVPLQESEWLREVPAVDVIRMRGVTRIWKVPEGRVPDRALRIFPDLRRRALRMDYGAGEVDLLIGRNGPLPRVVPGNRDPKGELILLEHPYGVGFIVMSKNGRGPPDDPENGATERTMERVEKKKSREYVVEQHNEPLLEAGDQLRQVSRATMPPRRWEPEDPRSNQPPEERGWPIAGNPAGMIGDMQRMAVMMALMALGAPPVDGPARVREHLHERESMNMHLLNNWAASWGERAIGRRQQEEEQQDSSGPLAEEGNRPEPREESSVRGGNQPPSGGDRGSIN